MTTDTSSVFSKGGGGTVFEQNVQTAFLITMLVRGKMPGLPTGEISEVAFQTTRIGFRTDDILIKVRSHQGEHQLLAQIKHNLTISVKNETFEEVMTAFWKDFTNPAVFNPILDRLLIIKSEMTQVDKKDTVVLLNWAKAKSSMDDFYLEVNRIENKIKALKVLSDVLQKANNGQAVDRQCLWQFLRCLVILEYDFGHESSTSETNFLNLIRLAKNQTYSISEKEIWNSVFAFAARLNKDGGSVTIGNIQSESFATYFDPAQLFDSYKAIRKLQEDSQAIINPLKNTIADFHLNRTELRNNLIASIANQKLTIVTGEPGAGKSALVKDVITECIPNTAVLIFKADQFNQSHLSLVFSGLGVLNCLTQFFACLAAIPKKIIVIDSFEKLLEGESDNAFRQFIHIINETKDISVVATSRTYAVDLLIQKYGLSNVCVLEVPLLTEGEDGEFKQVLTLFPRLQPLAANPQIRQVLRSPKYLDFAVQWVSNTTDNVSELTLSEFKDRLWQHVVENHLVIRNGMPTKRSKAFIEICLLRAQRMSLYVEPDQADATAIDELVNDNVLTKQLREHQYAPSHDILEDWALIKHIRRIKETQTESTAFYQQIGNKPALRRAFRLWVEDMLNQQPETIIQLVRDTSQQIAIERYWADELLVAIFRSNESAIFFSEFESDLLQNNAKFLQRALHLLRTACKERRTSSNSNTLYPIGSGWETALLFIQKHFTQLNHLRLLTIGLLIDWSYNLLYDNRNALSQNEIQAAKSILFSYLAAVEKKDNVWRNEMLKDSINGLIEVAFILTPYAQDEIKLLLQRAMPGLNDRYDPHPRSLYGKVRKMALSGVYNRPLTRFLPEQIIALARAVWLRKKRPKFNHPLLGEDYDDSYSMDHDWLDQDKPYGLESHLHFGPPGIYNTPVLNLLQSNQQYGVNFVLEMVNYCTEHYVRSGRSKDDVPIQVNVILSDESVIQQWGNHVLWQVYRATVVASDILESILMSLEKYLLDLAAYKSDNSRSHLQQLYEYLLRHSSSVAISSVLTSVAMAYPEEVDQAMLPLLSTREFYQWDWKRALEDQAGALAIVDFDIPYAQKERIQSNNLPHRKQYGYGLSEFVRHVQFNIGSFNKVLHERFDHLNREVSIDDIYWRKLLNEIDSRKWEIRHYDENLGGFITEPNYEPDVQVIVNEHKPLQEQIDQAWTDKTWIDNIYKQKDEVVAVYEVWHTIYNRYQATENIDTRFDRPVMLAIIGLRDLNADLTNEEQKWSFDMISVVIESLIQVVEGRRHDIEYELQISPHEINPALTSLPLLLKNAIDQEAQELVVKLLFKVLMTYFVNHEMEPILASLREQLWEVNGAVANRVWLSLVRFSQVRKTNEKEYWKLYNNKELQKQVAQSEELFVTKALSGKIIEAIDFKQINFTNWESHFLIRAFMMLPYNNENDQQLAYRMFLLPLFLKGLDREYDQEGHYNQRPLIYPEDQSSLQECLRDYLLNCNNKDATDVFEVLLQQIMSPESYHSSSYQFVEWTLKRMITEVDQIVYNKSESISVQTVTNFWRIWDQLYSVLKQSDKHPLASLLFLEIEWHKNKVHWIPLEGKKNFIKRVTDHFGPSHIGSLIKLISTVGDQTLLPVGLHWVTTILSQHPDILPTLPYSATERLIDRLYQRYIISLKTEVYLLNDFIWLLDQMINFGSSQAYITRENLITYKKVSGR